MRTHLSSEFSDGFLSPRSSTLPVRPYTSVTFLTPTILFLSHSLCFRNIGQLALFWTCQIHPSQGFCICRALFSCWDSFLPDICMAFMVFRLLSKAAFSVRTPLTTHFKIALSPTPPKHHPTLGGLSYFFLAVNSNVHLIHYMF